jgi:hypothetical protein
MVESADQLMEHADIVIVGNGAKEFAAIVAQRSPDQVVIDLVRIGEETSADTGYEGIAW